MLVVVQSLNLVRSINGRISELDTMALEQFGNRASRRRGHPWKNHGAAHYFVPHMQERLALNVIEQFIATRRDQNMQRVHGLNRIAPRLSGNKAQQVVLLRQSRKQ